MPFRLYLIGLAPDQTICDCKSFSDNKPLYRKCVSTSLESSGTHQDFVMKQETNRYDLGPRVLGLSENMPPDA